MNESVDVMPDRKRYSVMAGASMLFAIVASVPIAWLAVQSNIELVSALGLLLVPASVVIWISITIRALHLSGFKFWTLKSTYIPLGGAIAALFILFLASLPLLFSMNDPSAHLSPISLKAAAIVIGIAIAWCAWSNWTTTRDIYLSPSLTVLQVMLGASVVGVLLLLLSRHPQDDD